MQRLPLDDVRPGLRLALPIVHPDRRHYVLLRAGFELDEEALRRLGRLGLEEVWVEPPGRAIAAGQRPAVARALARDETGRGEADPPDESSSADERRREHDVDLARDLRCLDRADPISQYVSAFAVGIEHRVGRQRDRIALDRAVRALLHDSTCAGFIGEAMHGEHELLHHGVEVALLSTLLGLRVERYVAQERRRAENEREVSLDGLARGGLLHDLGVIHLPQAVRRRWQESHDERDPAWQEHPEIGFRLVNGRVDASASVVVIGHHQYWDGSGFPARSDWYGRRRVPEGEHVHIFARIAAVADQFDERRRRVPDARRPALAVLHELCDPDIVRRFDPVILRALFDVVPAHAPGQVVTLSDARTAIVLGSDRARPCRPIVQIAEDADSWTPHVRSEILDLRERRDLRVAATLGEEVGGLHFERPEDLLPTPEPAASEALRNAFRPRRVAG